MFIKFLGILLFIGMIGFLILGVFLGGVVRLFRSGGQKTNNRRSAANRSNSSNDSPTTQKKFSKNEGEYVDYEEIKDGRVCQK
ncbi:DUF4834 family protein [Dysgonomonas sp. 511]|uniref:DUF4834 family protein n=1 Tax=Dysgonomonas sp. 511 TaxID=2302930 RepID=UPI0013D8D4BA|nr:DUF4834 family protein [Dysgonomonas sp. 511]NDV80276.1 DUF4834 domain-containing protein [Dysgonomonas sp. 511]